MSDGSIKIDTKIDDSGIKKGLKNVESSLGQVTKGFNVSKVAAAGFAGAAALGVGKVISVMNDCAATYREQEKAEKSLSAAAKNNPYLNDESVYNLKQFASELQKTSEVGDEVSIGLMAQLAAAGRTQEEIQDIMRASADMAASGTISLDGAVKNLNKTYSGLSGELGEVIPELKGLTAEQMKNGAAVKLVGDKYKGIAFETKQTSVQLGNAFGDLKENIGSGWDKAIEPAQRLLLDIITKANETIALSQKVKKAYDAGIKGDAEDINIQIQDKEKDIKATEGRITANKELLKQYKVTEEFVEANPIQAAERGIQSTKSLNENLKALQAELDALKKREAELKEQSDLEKANADAAAKANTAENNKTEQNKAAVVLINKYNKSLADQIAQIELKAKLEGKSLDDAAIKQEILNAQIAAYMGLIAEGKEYTTKSGAIVPLVTENNEAAKKLLEAIGTQGQAVDEATKKEQDAADSLEAATKAADEARALIEQLPVDIEPEVKIQLDIDAIHEQAEKLREDLENISGEELEKVGIRNDERLALIEQVNAKELELTEALEKQKEDLRKQGIQKEREDFAAKVAMLNDYMQQANQIAESIQQFATKQIETERDLRIAEIQNSEMSEEEKEKAILDVKRDSAKEQYKIDMFAWSASLLAATANIAQGVSKAIAQGGVAGIITGALVAASGAMQIASIVASKPRPPAFASGGIATGGIAGRDSIDAKLMPGEIVFNNRQQRELWETANGRRGAAGANIVINNSAANMVTAQPKISKDKIELMIDARVKASMSKGRYNDSFRQMQGGMNGAAYTI